jgi:pyruvate kinase
MCYCLTIRAAPLCRQGLENFHDILKEADAIMVSRGDLGSSIPVEKVSIS